MIVRIARVKVGHRQAFKPQKAQLERVGLFVLSGLNSLLMKSGRMLKG